MREPGRRARLAQESLAHLGGVRQERREHLEGDLAIELDVLSEVDHAHSASPELALNVVLAGERGGEGGDVRRERRHAAR